MLKMRNLKPKILPRIKSMAKRWALILIAVTIAFGVVECFIVNDIHDRHNNPIRIFADHLNAPRPLVPVEITEAMARQRWEKEQKQIRLKKKWMKHIDLIKANLGSGSAAARLSQAYCSGDRDDLSENQLLSLWRKSALRGFHGSNNAYPNYDPLPVCLQKRSVISKELLLRNAQWVRVLVPLTADEASGICQKVIRNGSVPSVEEWNALKQAIPRLGQPFCSSSTPQSRLPIVSCGNGERYEAMERVRCQSLDWAWSNRACKKWLTRRLFRSTRINNVS